MTTTAALYTGRMRQLLLALTLAACGGGGSTKALDDLTERACACERDTACGKKVFEELQTFPEHNGRPSYSDHLTKTGLRLQECLSIAGVDPPMVVSALDKMAR